MAIIPLSHGLEARIDDADYPRLSRYRWWAKEKHGRWYAYGTMDGKMVQMHRLVTGAGPGQEVDHRNGDSLDNRKENLRLCTHSQNCANRAVPTQGRGVTWHAQRQRYMARIKKDGQSTYLGLFPTREEALRAYDKAAAGLFGEFARTNTDAGTCRKNPGIPAPDLLKAC